MSLPGRRLEPLTPAEEARDSLDSYNEAVRVIGERVKAGAPIPDFMQQGAAMSELPALIHQNGSGGLPDIPRDFKTKQAKLDAFIQYAAKVQDWPSVIDAIQIKISDQREFIAEFWDELVPGRGNPALGTERPKSSDQNLLTAPQAEKLSGVSHVQVSRWRKHLQDEERYANRLLQAARKKADLAAADNFRGLGTGDNEWFTPAHVIAAAREVMGEIDLDPATHPAAQKTVDALNCFTAAENGLEQEWHGRVWLNPPYAAPLITQFANKLVDEVSRRNVQQAIMLTHNYTDSAWFHHAESAADLLCFTRGRVRFVDIYGVECAPTQGQAFFYFGPEGDRFREVFSRFGFVR